MKNRDKISKCVIYTGFCSVAAQSTSTRGCFSDREKIRRKQICPESRFTTSVRPLRRITLTVSVRQSYRSPPCDQYLNILPASLSILWLTETVSVTVPCHTRIPPTGTVRRGVSWSRFRNKTTYSATKQTTSNAILCCLSFSYSGNLASSHPS